jgi:hypothetical protein
MRAMALALFTDEERANLNGFLGVKWGATLDEVGTDMQFMFEVAGTKMYTKNEKPSFGLIPVKYIEYSFVDGRLVNIRIEVDQQYPRDLLLFALETNFGKFEKAVYASFMKNLPKTLIMIYDGHMIMVGTKNIRMYTQRELGEQ